MSPWCVWVAIEVKRWGFITSGLVRYKCGSTHRWYTWELYRSNWYDTMTKKWSTTTLVALALLGCLVWTEVEAQVQKPSTAQQTQREPIQVRQQYQATELLWQSPQVNSKPQVQQQRQVSSQQNQQNDPKNQLLDDHHKKSQVPQPRKPIVPQKQYKPQLPKQPPMQSCEVTPDIRIPCGYSDISAAGCEAINCCFDGQQCYFGKAGEFLKRLSFRVKITFCFLILID